MMMDFHADKDFGELLAEAEEQSAAREAEEKKQRELREYLEVLYKKVLGHYNGLNLSKYRQLYDYAKTLDYGTDVFHEGEWVTVKSIETKEKYIKVVRRAYEELKEYEKILFEDWRELDSVIDKYGGGIIFPVDIQSIDRMCNLCIMYHEEVEFLGEFIHEPEQAGEHGGMTKNPIPMELCTPAASSWLQRAVEAGFLDENYMPTDKLKTKPQKALFAEMFSKKNGIKNKYSPFEKLWGIRGLRQQRYKSTEVTGKVNGGFDITVFFESQKR